MANSVILIYGRFNPPTIGHELLFRSALESALKEPTRTDVILFISPAQDRKKSPLTYQEKVKIIRKTIPELNIGPITASRIPLTALDWVFSQGYRNITIWVGKDRMAAFDKLATQWKNYSDDHQDVAIDIHALPRENEMSSEKVSGTTARKYALDGNFVEFQKILMGGSKNPALAKDTMSKIQERLSAQTSKREKTSEELEEDMIARIVEMTLATEAIGDLYNSDNPGARPITDTDTRVPEDTENNKSFLVLYPERRLKYSMIEKLRQKREQQAWNQKYEEWRTASKSRNTK